MDFIDILREKAFLGHEFLTWLWFKAEQNGGRISTAAGVSVEAIFLDRMTLDIADADTPQRVSIKGEQSELREAKAALREGKKIEEALLSVKCFDNDFSVNLKATWFSFASFRTPPILPNAESDAPDDVMTLLLEKVALIQEGLSILDELFATFLRLRLSVGWQTELFSIRQWVAEAA